MKNKILAPTYFYTFIAISIILHFIFPIRQVLFHPWSYFGALQIGFGILINIWADRLFKKHKTTENPFKGPSSLVVSGPFKISRHPMYLGMQAILLGVSIICGTLITFAIPILFAILIEILYIPVEENNLEKIFGNQYHKYKGNN